MLHAGELADKEVEIQVSDAGPSMSMPTVDIPGMPGAQMGMLNLGDILGKALGGGKTKSRKMTVSEAHGILMAEESDKLLDQEKVVREAVEAVQQKRDCLY